MNKYLWGAVIALLCIPGAACIPRQVRPVADIDPAPFLHKVISRQAAFDGGISGSLELEFKRGRRRVHTRAYIVAFPDGRFRLEVPGPFGGTHVVMCSDNVRILAYYPAQNEAFVSPADAPSLSRHLPFPVTIEPAGIFPLIMGSYPGEEALPDLTAQLMDSGERRLTGATESGDRIYTYVFRRGSAGALKAIRVLREGIRTSINTREEAPFLPLDFEVELEDTVLSGEWDLITPFEGDETALKIELPDSVSVTSLEGPP